MIRPIPLQRAVCRACNRGNSGGENGRVSGVRLVRAVVPILVPVALRAAKPVSALRAEGCRNGGLVHHRAALRALHARGLSGGWFVVVKRLSRHGNLCRRGGHGVGQASSKNPNTDVHDQCPPEQAHGRCSPHGILSKAWIGPVSHLGFTKAPGSALGCYGSPIRSRTSLSRTDGVQGL